MLPILSYLAGELSIQVFKSFIFFKLYIFIFEFWPDAIKYFPESIISMHMMAEPKSVSGKIPNLTPRILVLVKFVPKQKEPEKLVFYRLLF